MARFEEGSKSSRTGVSIEVCSYHEKVCVFPSGRVLEQLGGSHLVCKVGLAGCLHNMVCGCPIHVHEVQGFVVSKWESDVVAVSSEEGRGAYNAAEAVFGPTLPDC